MTRILGTVLVLSAAIAASADVVTARWGVTGHLQHPGTLKYVEKEGEAATPRMTFDLSALPKRAKVYRARLVLQRKGWDYNTPFVLEPTGEHEPRPLKLVAPFYRWFDARPMLRNGLIVRSAPAFDRNAAFLEVTYEGKLTDPPQQVSGLKAFYRGGQVFLRWKEIDDLAEGQVRYAWGDLIKKLRGYNADGPVPKDADREIRYRVFRHDEPITATNIGRATLLAEVVPGSGFNTRIVKRIWQGENRPSKLDDAFIAVRLGVEPGKPLDPGVGLYVHTCPKAGRGYYAVITAVNGVGNTSQLSKENTTGPIAEKVAEPEPVLQDETFTKGAYNRTAEDLITRRYVIWCAPPLAPHPLQYGFVIQYHPNRIGKPAALELNHGKGHAGETPNLGRWQRRDAILLAVTSDPQNGLRMGANNCHGTLKSFRQGRWRDWTWNRNERLVRWARAHYAIDEQDTYCYGSHWGQAELRHPEIFSVFIGWGTGEYTRGFVDWNRASGVWGPPSAYAGKPDAENPYVACNFTRFVASDPARRLPVQMLIPCTGSHTSEMSFASRPKFFRALTRAKQPFSAAIGKASWGFAVPAMLKEFNAGRLKIRRDQSKPAFAHCTIDDNPGCGDIQSGDGKGLLNGFLLWESDSIVDERGRWEMTVYLHASAPLDACRVDLTPRHCQKFTATPGAKLKWTNTAVAGGKPVASGTATADARGLVTLSGITVTKGRNRIRLEQ